MMDPANDRFLTIAEAAELLRMHRRTLDNLRWRGEGPRYRRHGGRIVYLLSELLAWSDQRRVRLSKDQAVAGAAPVHTADARDGLHRASIPTKPHASSGVEREPERRNGALSRGFRAASDRGPGYHSSS